MGPQESVSSNIDPTPRKRVIRSRRVDLLDVSESYVDALCIYQVNEQEAPSRVSCGPYPRHLD